MRLLVAVALFGVVLELVGNGAVRADVPSAATSFVSPCFVSCPFGDASFSVIVRKLSNQPMPDATVVLLFGDCSGTVFCPTQEPGTTIDLAGHTARRTSDINGSVVFHLHMGGLCPGARMEVTANGVILAYRNVATVDQDGNLVVDAADQALVAGKVGSADASADFDCNGAVDAADEATFAGHLAHACDATTPVEPRSWGRVKVVYR